MTKVYFSLNTYQNKQRQEKGTRKLVILETQLKPVSPRAVVTHIFFCCSGEFRLKSKAVTAPSFVSVRSVGEK